MPALARTANPPAGLTGCIYHFERWYDCHSQRAFALDSDGRVWQWINTRCALGMLGVVLIAFVVSGLIYLLLSSLLAMVWLGVSSRPAGMCSPRDALELPIDEGFADSVAPNP